MLNLKMKIACLGWGSLIWKPESLLIQREWFKDGPFLPIEYTRKSNDGRLTLVISNEAKLVRTLWAIMDTVDLSVAITSLRIRERIGKNNFNKNIGSILVEENQIDPIKISIKIWAQSLQIDAVIWTSLLPKFDEEETRIINVNEALTYFKNCDVNTLALAKEYIRKTPKQIDTDFRRTFEKVFNWTCLEQNA